MGPASWRRRVALWPDRGVCRCATEPKTPQRPHTPPGNDAKQRAMTSRETLAVQALWRNPRSANRTRLPSHDRGHWFDPSSAHPGILGVLGHLFALIPRQSLEEMVRESLHGGGQWNPNGFGGAPVREREQHHAAGPAFNERADRDLAFAHDQVAFPMAGPTPQPVPSQ